MFPEPVAICLNRYCEWQFWICVEICFLMLPTALSEQKTFQFDFSAVKSTEKNAKRKETLKFINLWEKFCSFRNKLYIFISNWNPFAVRKWRLLSEQPSRTTWNIFSIKFHRQQTRHHWNLNIRGRILFITTRSTVLRYLLRSGIFATWNDIVGRRSSSRVFTEFPLNFSLTTENFSFIGEAGALWRIYCNIFRASSAQGVKVLVGVSAEHT